MIVQEIAVPSTPEIGRPVCIGQIAIGSPCAWLNSDVVRTINVARINTAYWLTDFDSSPHIYSIPAIREPILDSFLADLTATIESAHC